MPFTIGVLRETTPGETRVAAVPDGIDRYVKAGYSVLVERNAGEQAGFGDAAYEAAGAKVGMREEVLQADIVLGVSPAISDLREGSVVIGQFRPLDDADGIQHLAERGVTALAVELVPRITRAQSMDVLSAMSTISGYKAVLLAADKLSRFFPLLTTAAGTIRPAQVLVLGAGVAGLQALATARRLGAVTSSYDVRAAAREQVESVGARFIELDLSTQDAEDAGGYAKALAEDEQERQVNELAKHVGKMDVVISTALIPGRPAPRLISREAVESMKPGSVIIDLAAANGGNCDLTKADEPVNHNGVRILGPTNLPATMPEHASSMLAKTYQNLLLSFTKEGAFAPDPEDEVYASTCVTRAGKIVNERVKNHLESLISAD